MCYWSFLEKISHALQTYARRIAEVVCCNFLENQSPTTAHSLIVRFEEPDLPFEMVNHGLLRSLNNQKDCLPSAGTFALLPRDSEISQRAKKAFIQVSLALRHLFKTNDPGKQYSAQDIASLEYGGKENISAEDASLGLYLWSDRGVLSPMTVSPDGLSITQFGVPSTILRYKDVEGDWEARRTAMTQPAESSAVPWPILREDSLEYEVEEAVSWEGDAWFWPVLHPAISPKARPAFEAKLYAESVEAALKVVRELIRERTGLDLDGVKLMNEAFSPNKPLLVFDPSGSETAKSIQEGYHRIFHGMIQAVRNPKAHGFVEITENRCLHFLFFASMLATTVDQATDGSNV